MLDVGPPRPSRFSGDPNERLNHEGPKLCLCQRHHGITGILVPSAKAQSNAVLFFSSAIGEGRLNDMVCPTVVGALAHIIAEGCNKLLPVLLGTMFKDRLHYIVAKLVVGQAKGISQ